jgi:hypothetical protein
VEGKANLIVKRKFQRNSWRTRVGIQIPMPISLS